MLGINTPEMYGWYLDRSLEEARQELKRVEPYRAKGTGGARSPLPRIRD